MLFLGKRLLHAGLILLGVTLICYLLLFWPPDRARRFGGRSCQPQQSQTSAAMGWLQRREYRRRAVHWFCCIALLLS